MENNLINHLGICVTSTLDMLEGDLNVLYYSHIPTIIISLIFGFFVFLKGEKGLPSRLFFTLSIFFVTWAFLDLFTWLSLDTRVIMFTWSLTSFVEASLFVLSLYFVYVFIEKKDVSFWIKGIGAFLLLPLVIAIPTTFNLTGFNADECYALENSHFLNYKYCIEILFTLILVIYSLYKIKKAKSDVRQQIVILFVGTLLFLLSFFSAVFLSGYLMDNGWGVKGYGVEIYGLFGSVFFMGFQAYLIVKYKAFNIKLLSAQSIMIALIILIASQFAFIQNPTNKILNGITLLLSIFFGWQLVRSVKREVMQKEELLIANEKLQKLDQAKSEFISIASHQLRTPLTVIKGYVSMVMDGNFGAVPVGIKDALSKVNVSNERLIKLVEDLLNISRIESGRLLFTWVEKPLEEMVASVCGELTGHATRKGLKFEFIRPSSTLPLVKMDEEKLRQVVMNLIDNSIKYTPKGSVSVSLKKKENNILFCVSDSGVGVLADDIPNLFKKFSRGTGISLMHTDGTGLGLYVVKQMIELHGGRAWVESAGEGKGSKFYFEIPFVKK